MGVRLEAIGICSEVNEVVMVFGERGGGRVRREGGWRVVDVYRLQRGYSQGSHRSNRDDGGGGGRDEDLEL